MKIEQNKLEIAVMCGSCKDEVKLPDGSKGEIVYNYEYSSENETLRVPSGTLKIGENASVTFDKFSSLRVTRSGKISEEWDIFAIIAENFAKLVDNLKTAEFTVKFNNR